MAKKRVIAYYMDDSEAAAAGRIMENVQTTESFMIGDVEESDLPRLKESGCIVQSVGEPERPSLVDRARAAVESVGPRAGTRPVRRPRAPERPAIVRPNYYRLTLSGPLLEAWRNQLESHGVKIISSLPGFAMTARIESANLSSVADLEFVSSVELHEGDESRPRVREMALSRGSVRTDVRAMITYDVMLREAEDLGRVRDWLAGNGVEVAAAAGNKIRIYLLEDSPLLGEIADLPEVAVVEAYVPPKLDNDQARILLGIQPANPGAGLEQEGDGQIVGVADTGLDDAHPDIPASRRVGVVALGRPGDSSDPHGHGTHVTGSVLGDGTASGGQFRGAAPRARLFFQSLLDSQGGLGGLPFRLQDLFDEAYRSGARIHNNSWGAATSSVYRVTSSEVDDFAQTHKDMLIVISAGNEGTAADPPPPSRRNSQPGFVDWLSIGSPATAKNALTVGASQNNRTSGGYSTLRYGVAWPQDFPDPPVKGEPISGNPESMAAFSSRGPCDSYRIKPDVVAPGTDIVSCKSRLAPTRHFWGPYSNSNYAYMGGTSMAAPLVSGCAALVREYYAKERNTAEPSAALVRATIINGTRRLTGNPAVADFPDTPNYHQGFGCVDMSHTIPSDMRPGMKLEFFDNWQDPTTHLSATGQRRRFQVTVGAGQPLRICMAYTDPPGPGLNNNLNLLLQDPEGKKRMGNEQVPMSLHIPDPTNNVEIIRIDEPAAGAYVIQISASNLLQPPQDFALVVTGDVSGFVRIG